MADAVPDPETRGPAGGIALGLLAERAGVPVRGDASVLVSRVVPLDVAGPGDLAFATSRKHAAFIPVARASAFIVPPGVDTAGRPALLSDNVYLAVARALEVLVPEVSPPAGVHPTAVVDAAAELGPEVRVAAHATIEAGARVGAGTWLGAGCFVGRGAVIGAACRIHPNVTLEAGVRLGDRVVVQAGAVIGSDGFGYAEVDGGWVKIPQVGTVVIEDDVEVGANATIDRATLGETRVGRGAKIDNLVHLAHNVVVGPGSALAAQVGVAGSSRIGARTRIGGQVGIAGHLTVGDDVRIASKSGVPQSIPAGVAVGGIPAMPEHTFRRVLMTMPRLAEMRAQLRGLVERLGALEARSGSADGAGDVPGSERRTMGDGS